MELTDNQLVRQVRAGDRAAFGLLVERYQRQIYNLMYRFCGSADEAADLTQEAFCRAFERLTGYRRQATFFSWLYTLALNCARDWRRRRSVHDRRFGEYGQQLVGDHPVPERIFEKKESTGQLLRALERLPEDRRELLILKFRHECSIRELGEIFSLSESAVKMRIKRSLDELGGLLNGGKNE